MKKQIKEYIRLFRWLLLNWTEKTKIFNAQIGNNITKATISDFWLIRFVTDRIKNNAKKIAFFSVNGKPLPLWLIPARVKIFYTFENVHVADSHWQMYEHLYLDNNNVGLSLGFDYIDHSKYLRFPYWLVTFLEPNYCFDDVTSLINDIESKKSNYGKKYFCAFICRNDYFGDRAKFADEVSEIGDLSYPGNFRNNDRSMKEIYNDDKIEYLKQFKFNLCPENSDNKGYVTEKIFDAIKAGCIPIYWGSENDPEPEILNQNRILFLKLGGDNAEVLSKIKQLNEDELAYREFIEQPIFNVNAAEIIYSHFERLEQKIREIVK